MRQVDHDDIFAGLAEQAPQGWQRPVTGVKQAKTVGVEIAFPEVEYPMLALLSAGHHGGPGLGCEGVHHGAQSSPTALGHQPAQVGKMPGLGPGLDEIKRGAVQANDNQTVAG